MPAEPPSIFTPATAGGEPSAPAVAYVPAQAGSTAEATLTGATTSGVNGALPYAGSFGGKMSFTSNGNSFDANYGTTFTSLIYTAGKWQVNRWVAGFAPTYTASITSSADSPDGLTLDSPLTGVGVVSISVTGGISAPPSIFIPASDS